MTDDENMNAEQAEHRAGGLSVYAARGIFPVIRA